RAVISRTNKGSSTLFEDDLNPWDFGVSLPLTSDVEYSESWQLTVGFGKTPKNKLPTAICQLFMLKEKFILSLESYAFKRQSGLDNGL
ncbi:MAG: hypothetical protein JKX73_00730, partial [Flavobacteriales bacterium]|nr:hypothetical protein [Flavobacteriales bacterium]